jgi:hypothetical protein
MNKVKFISLAVSFLLAMVFTITGCHYLMPPSSRTYSQSSSQTSSKSPSYSLYKITEEEDKTIEGVKYRSSMLIYRDIIFTVSIYNMRKDGDKGYNFFGLALVYEGKNWLFLKSMQIKIDDEDVITLVDKNPYRKVERGYGGSGVRESLSFLLRDNAVTSLQECNSFAMQLGKLIEIPPEGIEKTKEFLAERVVKNDSGEEVSEDDSDEQVSED